MHYKKFLNLNVLAMATAIVLAGSAVGISAQGRSGGGGRPANAGSPSGSPGVDRGLGNATIRSGGRSDDGLNNASIRSNGRSDNGIDRARQARENSARVSDNDVNRYRGLSKRFGTTPEEMRLRYQAALIANPNLNFGNFVAANVIADNLNARFPAITSTAILAGLADGESIGQTLQSLGLSKEQSRDAKRNAEERIKLAKNRNK